MIKQPTEPELQALSMKIEDGPMSAIIQHFEGWANILREADSLTEIEKVYARRFLTWTVCTPEERELLAAHRKQYETQ